MTNLKSLIIGSVLVNVGLCSKMLTTPDGDFPIVPLTWLDVPIWPGKAGVELNGTLDQVMQQAVELNPKWEEEIAPHWLHGEEEDLPAERRGVSESPNLDKRDYNVCESGYPTCSVIDAQNEIAWTLRRNPHQRVRLNPGVSCSSVICNEKVQIWACNLSHNFYETNWDNIANAATVIVNDCGWCYPAGPWCGFIVSGWRFHSDGCTVLVRGLGNYEQLVC